MSICLDTTLHMYIYVDAYTHNVDMPGQDCTYVIHVDVHIHNVDLTRHDSIYVYIYECVHTQC